MNQSKVCSTGWFKGRNTWGCLRLNPKIGRRARHCSDMGGAAFEFFVHHALLAISQGRCECAL